MFGHRYQRSSVGKLLVSAGLLSAAMHHVLAVSAQESSTALESSTGTASSTLFIPTTGTNETALSSTAQDALADSSSSAGMDEASLMSGLSESLASTGIDSASLSAMGFSSSTGATPPPQPSPSSGTTASASQSFVEKNILVIFCLGALGMFGAIGCCILGPQVCCNEMGKAVPRRPTVAEGAAIGAVTAIAMANTSDKTKLLKEGVAGAAAGAVVISMMNAFDPSDERKAPAP